MAIFGPSDGFFVGGVFGYGLFFDILLCAKAVQIGEQYQDKTNPEYEYHNVMDEEGGDTTATPFGSNLEVFSRSMKKDKSCNSHVNITFV